MHLRPERFRKAIRRHGKLVEWWKAIPTSDYNPETNAYDRDSDTATEYGHIYVKQTLDNSVRALIQQVTKEVVDPNIGMIQVGDLHISFMPDEINPVRMDKFVLLETVETTREVHDKDVADVLHQADVVDIVSVQSNDGTVYVEGVDFELDGAEIVWLDGDESASPPAGAPGYVVEYRYHPVYWYLGVRGQTRGEQDGVPLPCNGVLTLKHPAAVQ